VKLGPSPDSTSGTGGAYRFSHQPTTLFFIIAEEKAYPLQWPCGLWQSHLIPAFPSLERNHLGYKRKIVLDRQPLPP
jgi:hypothetical protein